MSYSLYDATVPLAKSALKALTNILKTGEAVPESANLLAARLAPDMLPLTFQVKSVTDISTKIVARLHGIEPHVWEGDINTFADCYARIAKAEEILATADKDLINQRQSEIVTLGMGSKGTFQMPGANYANGYVLPNLFFHLTTAYNILRKEGVPLGKTSYLESFIGQYLQQQ
ncbi:helix-turn-helix domain-containing [Trichoderma arundinaceum]|uniref:Helix-turn-helix domain-containing n=1 Tax=Trichoderma arundinaceum TaxID=490622 RepID=A0A395NQB7_TRIAR|nr:helix-turn-helix domain-containing [Trichoderma arundinaceum]